MKVDKKDTPGNSGLDEQDRKGVGAKWRSTKRASQCHKPPVFDGWNPTHRNGDEWGGWFMTLLYPH